ncbi:hypothetical protein KC365_g141 [Hortaea werneckii]|nr:hypothetical protein KC339_g137 [Hortaea werneckii]KAI7245899.1 hypothetical protein KC365_g141 [Hortaea werneckii]
MFITEYRSRFELQYASRDIGCILAFFKVKMSKLDVASVTGKQPIITSCSISLFGFHLKDLLYLTRASKYCKSLLFCLFIRQFPRSASSPLLPDADHKRHTIMN